MFTTTVVLIENTHVKNPITTAPCNYNIKRGNAFEPIITTLTKYANITSCDLSLTSILTTRAFCILLFSLNI